MNYKLAHPIPVKPGDKGAGVHTELEFGRLKAKHLKLFPEKIFSAADDVDMSMSPVEFFPIIAGLSNVELVSIEELDFEDLIPIVNLVTEYMGKFLPRSLETGTN